MLFKILKLFGLDVPAKVAAAKSVIEQRVEEVTGYAKQVTQTAAVVAALSAVAGVLVAMAVGVGLPLATAAAYAPASDVAPPSGTRAFDRVFRRGAG
jgi:hypothetical protein